MSEYGEATLDEFKEGYEAGVPFEGEFDVPEYVQTIRDELNTVRAACSKLCDEMWKPAMNGMQPMGGMSYMGIDPIEKIRYDQSLDALYKEEARLQGMLKDAEWIIPPLLEAPHNTPTREKARKMLHEGTANGQPLTDKQRRFFGLIASGKKPRVKSS